MLSHFVLNMQTIMFGIAKIPETEKLKNITICTKKDILGCIVEPPYYKFTNKLDSTFEKGFLLLLCLI